MGILKGLVIVMGLAIIIGATVLATLISQRAGKIGAAPEATVASPVVLPAGARVVESRLEGGRILLRIVLAPGGERILVVDPKSGRVLSRLDLKMAPAP
jgi:hypothetical protein